MSDELAVLREAMSRHQKTKHPPWARIPNWASARLEAAAPRRVVGGSGKKVDTEGWFSIEAEGDVLDVPRLFAAFVPGVKSATGVERVKLLAKRKDPRIVTGLLGLLERPAWRAGTALPFFKACIEVLVASNDVRAREGLESLSTRYKAIVDSSIGEVIGGHCRTAAKAMAEVTTPALPKADEARLDELERHFDVERRAADSRASDQREAKVSDEGLLAAIYASPDDDGPRLVFADALADRGDPRGEFISLQVRRAAGQGTLELLAREQELHADTKRRSAWALPLSSSGDVTFHRGFPVHASLSARNVKTVVGVDAWATVEDLTLPYGLSGKMLRALVDHPVMSRLRRVRTLTSEVRALLGDAPRRWAGVRLQYNADEAVTTALADQFPALTSLVLSSYGAIDPAALARLRLLEHLTLNVTKLTDYEWLAELTKLHTLELGGVDGALLSPSLLPRLKLKRLKALTVNAAMLERLTGLSVDVLDLGNLAPANILSVSRAVGRVRELQLNVPYPRPVLEACLPVWSTLAGLERVRLDRNLTLERAGDGWVLFSGFSALQLGRSGDEPLDPATNRGLPGAALLAGIDRLVVMPQHPTVLSRASPLPSEEQLRDLLPGWGARLEVKPLNDRLLLVPEQREW